MSETNRLQVGRSVDGLLRDRIAAVIASGRMDRSNYELADAVIRELGQRRCERCRSHKPVDQFPMPHEGSNQMRPFCIPCTDYIEWATS